MATVTLADLVNETSELSTTPPVSRKRLFTKMAERIDHGQLKDQLKTTEKQLGGITGHGFQPGQSGNRGGRPKGLAAYVRQQTRHGRKMVDFMLDILEGKPMEVTKLLFDPSDAMNPPVEVKWKQTPSLHYRMEAAAWLADRGFGKAVEKLEVGDHRSFLFVLRHPPGTYDPLQTFLAQPTEPLEELRLPVAAPTPWNGKKSDDGKGR